MSAGDELAGEGEAGDDDVLAPTETPLTRAAAIHFDAQTRDFPLGPDGRYVAIHPVDSKMEMACLIAVGSIASSATTGNGLRGIEYLDPLRLSAQVKDAIRVATLRLVSDGDATIDKVEHEANGGRLLVAVSYWNNRLPGARDQQRRTIKASS